MGRRRPTYDDRALPVPVPLNLQRIRIILVEPQEPGNIGATARAMKTMGLTGLTLVRPAPFAESKEATYMAHRAGEVLAAAQVTETLEEARRVAIERMVAHAQGLGANAVVGLRFDSTDMGEQQGMAEIVAYGTAVIVNE